MKTLTLLRHAKAVEGSGVGGDHDRPLNVRGHAAAEGVGLATAGAIPQLILCSTARRTRETVGGIVATWGHHPTVRHPQIRYERELYLAEPPQILALIQRLDDALDEVWVVGHNPGLHDLARGFADRARPPVAGPDEHFPTAARAIITVDIVSWADIGTAHPCVVKFVPPPAG